MSVFENIAFPLRRHTKMTEAEIRARVCECLEDVHLPGVEKKRPSELSGGMRRRVGFARAISLKPDILLFDEPVSGVDVAGEELFCDFLSKVHRDSRFSLLLVSHDLSVVTRHADQVICLNRRLVCSGATTEVLTPENLAAMYGTDAHLFRHTPADGHGHLPDDGGR